MNAEEHIGLVYRAASQVRRRLKGWIADDAWEDVVQEGFVTLMGVCKHYNPDKGAFSTYAYPSIIRGMWHAVNQEIKRSVSQSKLELKEETTKTKLSDNILDKLMFPYKEIVIRVTNGEDYAEVSRTMPFTKRQVMRMYQEGINYLREESNYGSV